MKGAKFDSPFAFVHIISLCVLCLGSYFVFFALNLDSLLFLGLHLMFWCLALVVSQKQTKRNIRNRKLGIALFSSLCCERSRNCIEVWKRKKGGNASHFRLKKFKDQNLDCCRNLVHLFFQSESKKEHIDDFFFN